MSVAGKVAATKMPLNNSWLDSALSFGEEDRHHLVAQHSTSPSAPTQSALHPIGRSSLFLRGRGAATHLVHPLLDLLPAVVHVLESLLVLTILGLEGQLGDGESADAEKAAQAEEGASLHACERERGTRLMEFGRVMLVEDDVCACWMERLRG